ncbi:DUF6364 family protein [Psychrobacter sp. I-STPA10]|uniref:DUF6364 family protein n=1 Tax=Psychrobacter sp. I-STPA10 TaxID=2585769 RepID=UPI001E288B6F|nr:DUF6364 family protein [Psychrobacter sp. I-STPA10]
MQRKLTLQMDDELIKHAKEIAKQNGKSVSQMVADYFKQLAMAEDASDSHRLLPQLSQNDLLPICHKLDNLFEPKELSLAEEKALYHQALLDKHTKHLANDEQSFQSTDNKQDLGFGAIHG